MHQINIKKTIIYSIYKYTIISTTNLLFRKENIRQIDQFIEQLFKKHLKFYKQANIITCNIDQINK